VVELGVELCPVPLEPPAGFCAAARLAQASTADSSAILLVDISRPPNHFWCATILAGSRGSKHPGACRRCC
jgi:hypothetical protein